MKRNHAMLLCRRAHSRAMCCRSLPIARDGISASTKARTTLSRFPSREWSAGRRQGACEAPTMTNLCERLARVPQRERIASPSREARASCGDGVARPIAPTQRLPALHLRPRCTRGGGDHPSASCARRDEKRYRNIFRKRESQDRRGFVARGCSPKENFRHCERSEAIQKATKQELDCFVAPLLAMTKCQCACRFFVRDFFCGGGGFGGPIFFNAASAACSPLSHAPSTVPYNVSCVASPAMKTLPNGSPRSLRPPAAPGAAARSRRPGRAAPRGRLNAADRR